MQAVSQSDMLSSAHPMSKVYCNAVKQSGPTESAEPAAIQSCKSNSAKQPVKQCSAVLQSTC